MSRSEELNAMLAKARQYLDSAETLRQSRDYDSAVSRLYYAMFYCAEALLLSQGLTFSSHKAVIAAFGHHFVKTNRLPVEMHRWLRGGFEKRQVGDYEFVTRFGDADVIALQEQAREFVTNTAEFLKREGYLGEHL